MLIQNMSTRTCYLMQLSETMEFSERILYVRSNFKNFGTQPHFDDSRLECWFGDGAKFLLTLPSNCFGSFDLVL